MIEKRIKILITGAAGFIGFHLIRTLLNKEYIIVGIDNINDYYDVNLKYSRLAELGIANTSKCMIRFKYTDDFEYKLDEKQVFSDTNQIPFGYQIASSTHSNYSFIRMNLEDRQNLMQLFKEDQFDYVINLAAQAGVRNSIENPYCYIDSNINGFINILEGCRNIKIKHLVYASSSSVYGLNKKMPLSTSDNVDHPISLYAATKKANELMAHTYSHLYKVPTTGLRFFTVYGPWGRPDMALFKFTNAIVNNKTIDVYNYGNMQRDFTYINDIVAGVCNMLTNIPTEPNTKEETNRKLNPSYSPEAPYRLFNIGNSSPVMLSEFIEAIENKLGKKAKKNLLPIQDGDVPRTYADVNDLVDVTGYKPSTKIEEGINKFIDWYLEYFKIK